MQIVSGVPMRISVIGGGYVGLVSSVCLAELGHSVNLIEIDEGKVALHQFRKADNIRGGP